jgi:DNA-binding response OmpR family regulator
LNQLLEEAGGTFEYSHSNNMLTREGSTEVAVEAMKHGADDYLVKDTEGNSYAFK